MKINYLRMIWSVKIKLAKIKDGKGKDSRVIHKNSLLRKYFQNQRFSIKEVPLPPSEIWVDWRMRLRDYLWQELAQSRSERIGTTVLVMLMIIGILIPRWLRPGKDKKLTIEYLAAAEELRAKADSQYFLPHNSARLREKVYETAIQPRFFYFDPNTITADQWRELGLRDKTILTIERYRAKGGKFRNAEDILKIYGLPKTLADELLPYVRIADPPPTISSFPDRDLKKVSPRNIDINEADSSAFISLPGIGSKLAARILSFREKLGGFHSLRQLAEVYGLRDSTYQLILPFLRLKDPVVKKINLNKASLEELRSHPYIRYELARPILAYRDAHGPFSTVEELKKLQVVSEEIYQKLRPYLTIEE